MSIKEIKISVNPDDCVPEFRNNVDFCVGTGRMGLALHKEYMEQLEFVQKEIGFRHIRGHGLFCDDMAIYQEYRDENGKTCVEYNYTYLDRVFDSYMAMNIKPFIELGFMPSKLASGEQTVFYWHGNVTPPKSYDVWCNMVTALLTHLIVRYGRDEVVAWPVEVWNEPNLTGFWKDADMREYFRLFQKTFYAVKSVDERFRVGGPAVCGGTDEVWIRAFLGFCHENKLPVDFVTRHHYTCEIAEEDGHYTYPALSEPQKGYENLLTTREIIDSFDEYKGLEIHITEFNTSWDPKNVIHDTNKNAAYLAHQLSWLGDRNESYSYWTFGDVFEEQGVPFSEFYGGFGLVANGCIPKPTFWTFRFYKNLKQSGSNCVYRSDSAVILRKTGGGFCGILWNMSTERTGTENMFEISLPAETGGYCLITQTVDEECCNPLKLWHDMGETKTPTKEQKELLRRAAQPLIRSESAEAEAGSVKLNLTVSEYGVVYFELIPVICENDRGYDYIKATEK
ncbi:MAG: xylan 1,4-beta-xylosidase [Candidatus Ornithomonoglobus sp.]